MENKKRIRPLTPTERKFAEENHQLIEDFLKRSRLDIEEFYDVVVLDFLLAVEVYLNDAKLRERCPFEAVSYMYMRRAVYVHFRKQRASKRSSGLGVDVGFADVQNVSGISKGMNCNEENFHMLEYKEIVRKILDDLTGEQQRIFLDRLEGYTLKDIAESMGINSKRVYRQFGKIKAVVMDVMEL